MVGIISTLFNIDKKHSKVQKLLLKQITFEAGQ